MCNSNSQASVHSHSSYAIAIHSTSVHSHQPHTPLPASSRTSHAHSTPLSAVAQLSHTPQHTHTQLTLAHHTHPARPPLTHTHAQLRHEHTHPRTHSSGISMLTMATTLQGEADEQIRRGLPCREEGRWGAIHGRDPGGAAGTVPSGQAGAVGGGSILEDKLWKLTFCLFCTVLF